MVLVLRELRVWSKRGRQTKGTTDEPRWWPELRRELRNPKGFLEEVAAGQDHLAGQLGLI